MSTFAKRGSALLIGVLLVEMAARLLLTTTTPAIRWYDATAQLKIEQLEELDDVDVVFAGTSMAWQAFVPAEFTTATNLSAYNAGLAGGTPEVMERWLLEEVVPRTSPDVVVWGLSSLDLAPAYGEANRDTYDQALETRTSRLGKIEQALSPWSALVAERSVLRSVSDLWAGGQRDRDAQFAEARSILGTGGERLDFRTDRTDERARVMQARLQNFSSGRTDVATITSTVNALQAKGIDVILVELPVPPEFVALHPGGEVDYESVGARLARIAELNQTRFLQLTNGYESADFVDFTHLAEPATIRLTQEFSAEWDTSRSDTVGPVLFNPTEPTTGSCETELVEDEYGNQIEICTAGNGDPTPPQTSPTSDDRHSERLGDFLRFATVILSPCEAQADDEVDLSVFPSADQSKLTASLDVAASIAGRCTDGVASPDDLERLILSLEQISDVMPDPDRSNPGSNLDQTSRLAAGLDAAFGHFDILDPKTQSLFWANNVELGNTLRLLESLDTVDGPTTLLIGSSQTESFNARRLDEAIEGFYASIGQPGFDAEEWSYILERSFVGKLPDTVLWSTSTHRLLGDGGGRPCGTVGQQMSRTVEMRNALFTLTGWTGSQAEGLVGDDPATSMVLRTSIGMVMRVSNSSSTTTDSFEVPAERELLRYTDSSVCIERLEVLERQIASLLDRDVNVVLIVHPGHRAFLDLVPEDHAEADRLLEEMVARLGIDSIEPRELTDAESYDGIHSNKIGSERITSELIDAFTERGLVPLAE